MIVVKLSASDLEDAAVRAANSGICRNAVQFWRAAREKRDEERRRAFPIPPNPAGVSARHAKDATDERRTAAAKAREAVWCFFWGATTEGHDYWHDVALRLDRIAKGGM